MFFHFSVLDDGVIDCQRRRRRRRDAGDVGRRLRAQGVSSPVFKMGLELSTTFLKDLVADFEFDRWRPSLKQIFLRFVLTKVFLF